MPVVPSEVDARVQSGFPFPMLIPSDGAVFVKLGIDVATRVLPNAGVWPHLDHGGAFDRPSRRPPRAQLLGCGAHETKATARSRHSGVPVRLMGTSHLS